MLLKGKKALILGVANQRSIAWGIAQAFLREGAECSFTYANERLEKNLQKLTASVENPIILPCDVSKDSDIKEIIKILKEKWGTLDIIVHSVAYALTEDLSNGYTNTSRDGFLLAHEISSYSLTAVVKEALPILKEGSSIMTMSYIGSERTIQNYNVMGVAKASLEASARYLATDLGPQGIRVNVISPGPIKTLAATAIRDFSKLQNFLEERVPLRRNVTIEEVGDCAVFLASDLSKSITGEIIHVDAGFHMIGV